MKSILIFVLILFSSLLFAQTPFVCKGQYYLSLSKSVDSESGLYEVVIAPDGSEIIFNPVSEQIGATMNAIGYRSTDNFIYGVDPFYFNLYKLGSDGKAVDLGKPKGIPSKFNYYTGDVTPDGNYLLLIGTGGRINNMVLVDLNDPEYQVEVRTFDGDEIYDVAFDPFTSELYGFSGLDNTLKKIDITTGKYISNFASQPQVSHIGAVFFDTFGTLYGYGSIGFGSQNTLIKFDKSNGKAVVVAQGPNSQGNDGCSCPYSLSILKTVSTSEALPCTSFRYDFIIINNSGIDRDGIQFFDEIPKDFSIIGITKNPYGGTPEISNQSITIENMNIHPGVDTISLLVEVGQDALGFYQNQAQLNGLPVFLGESTVSDDPTTLQDKDSTSIEILPFDVDFIEQNYRICNDEIISIDASLYGVTYEWNDGSTTAQHDFSEAGMYSVTVSSDCEEKVVNIEIDTIGVSVDIKETHVQVALGDRVQLHTTVQPDNLNYSISWTNDDQNSISCLDCLNPSVGPFFDTVYQVSITDELGCSSTDRVRVEVIKDRDVYVPSIFSPNFDGINDWFSVFTKSKHAVVNLKVYDRWGDLVFDKQNVESNVMSQGWDGTFDGKAVQSGVYAWVAEITFLDGVTFLKFGDVTVVY